jgi:competence protein ComEA
MPLRFTGIRDSMRSAITLLAGLTLLTFAAKADLPPGPGREATVRVCGRCHSPERAASLHQDHYAWEETITKMVKLGAQGSDDEFEAILEYLSKNFAREAPGPININKAKAVDLEAGLLLRRSQAIEVVQYRTQNGDFKSLEDLKKIPGIDFQKIEARKARIVF